MRKKLVAVLLCAAIACLPVTERKAQAQAAPAALILSCALIATCIIIKVYSSPPKPYVKRKLVLQKCPYDGNWQSVCTNIVVLGTNTPMSVFSDVKTEFAMAYRVIELPLSQ